MAIDLRATSRAPATARRLAAAANRLLGSLGGEQRAAARFPFQDEERYVWHYTPIGRNGLRLVNMTGPQQRAALALLGVGLSARGARQAKQIMALEPILRESERLEQRVNRWVRDPELYWFSIFGEPGGAAPWGWRAGGHHLGLHFTVVDGELIAPTPLFFGANPAEVRHGSRAGTRTLAEEEELARAVLASLDSRQKQRAITSAAAPADLLTGAARAADPAALPSGLAYSAMTGEQRARLVALVRHYLTRATDEVAAGEWSRIERAGLDDVSFSWAGPEERGRGHYYLVKGRTFMVEYDNTQDGANHIHSVWRDFTNDWGEDLLAWHYAAAHRR